MQAATPSAIANIYDLIARLPAQGRFHALTQSTFQVPPPPRFFFGRFPGPVAGQFFRHLGLGPAGTFVVRDVHFHAEYLMAHGPEAIAGSELNIHPEHIAHAIQSIAGRQRPTRRIAGSVAYIFGPGHGIFGHWLVDFLPKLQVMAACGYDILGLNYLVPKSTPAWGLEFLQLLGITPERLIIFDPETEIVEMEEILLPTFLHNGVRVSPFFADAVASIRRAVLAGFEYAALGRQKARIYISRAKTSQSRPFLDRPAAEAIAADHGFRICHPEQLGIREQIRLFASAGSIIGEYGSAHHMSIFAAPGTVVCGLRGSVFHPGFIQSGVGQALGQPTGYVFGETDESDHRGAFTISEQSLRDCLDSVFAGQNFE